MFKRPCTDFWRVGIVPDHVLNLDVAGFGQASASVVWLPDPGPWRYLADPFGLHRGDALHVFVEAFDYRTKHAVIERHEFAADDLTWRSRQTILARPFHLSYPFVFEHDGETYMVPESHQANEIALYRAGGSLDWWELLCPLISDLPGADASLIFAHLRPRLLVDVLHGGGRRRARSEGTARRLLAAPVRPLAAVSAESRPCRPKRRTPSGPSVPRRLRHGGAPGARLHEGIWQRRALAADDKLGAHLDRVRGH